MSVEKEEKRKKRNYRIDKGIRYNRILIFVLVAISVVINVIKGNWITFIPNIFVLILLVEAYVDGKKLEALQAKLDEYEKQ